ncbi:MAG: DUF4215 domain-containing protein [Polyangiaceae bacterium]
MKRLISFAIVLATVVSVNACSSEKVAPQICTPGDNSNCNCKAAPDGTPTGSGTRLCRPDGKSFEPCRLSATEECPYGEEPTTDGGTTDSGTGPGDVDSCPGFATTIAPGLTKITGDTTNAKDDFNGKDQTACATGAGVPDVVYKLIPTGTGLLSAEVIPDGDWSPSMTIREGSCEEADKQFGCVPPGEPGQRQVLKDRPIVKGREYWLIIDGAAGQKSKGPFYLELNFVTQAICGDGTIDSGENCDDGNKEEGDGCAANCKGISGNPDSASTCGTTGGQPVHLWAKNVPVTGTGSTDRAQFSATANPGSAFTGTNASCQAASGGAAAEDHIYAVTPHDTGTLEVKLTGATFDAMLVGRKVCGDPASQFQCTGGPCNRCVNASIGNNGPETLTFAVQKDQVYSVGVDSAANAPNTGSYTISFTLKP